MTKAANRWLAMLGGPQSRLSVSAVGTVITSVVGAGLRFLLQAVLADVLGTHYYGRFAGLRAWGEFLARLPHRGYQGAVVRFLPGYENDGRWNLYRGLFVYSVLGTLVRGVLLGAVAFVVGVQVFDDPTVAVVMAMATVPGWSMMRMLKSVLQAQHQYFWASLIVEIGQPLVVAAGLLGFWLAGAEISLNVALVTLAVSLAGASIVSQALSWRSTSREVRQQPWIRETDFEEWNRSARLQFGAQMAINVIGMASVLILERSVEPSQLALYVIASRVAVLGRTVNSGVESIVSSRISAAWSQRDMAGIQRTVNNAIKLSTVPTVLMAAILVIFRGPILGIIGDEYRAAGTVLVIMLVGNVTNALTGPSGYVVAMTGNENVHAKIMISTAVGLVLGSLAVAAFGGIVAMAVVQSAANVAWNARLLIFARRQLGIKCYPNRGLLKR